MYLWITFTKDELKKNNGEKYNSMSRDHLVDNSVKSLDKVNQI